jgi:kynurenine formamidase
MGHPSTTPRWRQRPEGSNWGDFGPDDQLGSLNHIGPQERRSALAEAKEGLAFCLSLPLNYPGGSVLAPHRKPPQLRPTTRHGRPYFNYGFRNETAGLCDLGCDDEVTLSTQYSTQWDGFAHIGYEFDADGDGVPEACFYNGYRAGVHILPPDLRLQRDPMPLGVDAFAARPIQGRGVLVDLERHFGREAVTLGYKEIESVLRSDRVEVRKGDIVCFHTGFSNEILKMGGAPDPQRVHHLCATLDGGDTALLEWISASGLAAIAADNYAVERIVSPAPPGSTKLVPLHHHCLFKRGIPLGELWHLTELASWLHQRGRHAFLLTAPPLRLPGAIGSPVTPVATV